MWPVQATIAVLNFSCHHASTELRVIRPLDDVFGRVVALSAVLLRRPTVRLIHVVWLLVLLPPRLRLLGRDLVEVCDRYVRLLASGKLVLYYVVAICGVVSVGDFVHSSRLALVIGP